MNVTKVRWPEAESYNHLLLQIVLKEQERDPTSRLGVSNGWASAKNLFNIPETQPLVDFIKSNLAQACTVSGWGNILEATQYIEPHDHINSHLGGVNLFAGVYYIQVPKVAVLSFERGKELSHETLEAGDLVLFSSGQRHFVAPATGRRVSIAFNAKLEVKKTALPWLQ